MVAIITFSSILGCILLIHNARMIGKNLQLETEEHLRAMVGQNAERIETTMQVMGNQCDGSGNCGRGVFCHRP